MDDVPFIHAAVCNGPEDLLYDLYTVALHWGHTNALDKQGFAALHYAAKYIMVNIIKKLLAAQCGEAGQGMKGHIKAFLQIWLCVSVCKE